MTRQDKELELARIELDNWNRNRANMEARAFEKFWKDKVYWDRVKQKEI